MDNLEGLDALALGELIATGDLSPNDLFEATVQRMEQVNPKLNAVIHNFYDRAHESIMALSSRYLGQESKKMVFHGVPFLLKDLIAECRGAPLCEGSSALRNYVSREQSELVSRQERAGLILLGKTNTPEFGSLPTTEPAAFGSTVNPWNPGLSPGGSSGGSAAAVAAGIVPMAHASDAGGSIRVPASCCGVFGLKPTRGRNPLGPRFGDLAGGLICEHSVTRSVRDSAALLDVTSGPAPGDPYNAPPNRQKFLKTIEQEPGRLKIGVLESIPQGWHEETAIHQDCRSAVQNAARLCQDLGHRVEEIKAQELAFPGLYKRFGVIWCCHLVHVIKRWERILGREITEDQLEENNRVSYKAGLKRTGGDFLAAREDIQSFSRKMGEWYHKGGYDVILSPTICVPPVKLGEFHAVQDEPMRWARMSRTLLALTYVYNLTGQPAMSVPLFWNRETIPIGVQFAGRFGDENTLFGLAAQLEQARPWAVRIPPIHAMNDLSLFPDIVKDSSISINRFS